MGPIGSGVGYTGYMFFMSPDDSGQVAKNGIFMLCWTCAVSIISLYIVVIFVIKEKPAIPPTKSASMEITEPIMKSLKNLFTNCNFVFVMNSFALVYACLTTFSQEVSLVITPFFGLEVLKDLIIGRS